MYVCFVLLFFIKSPLVLISLLLCYLFIYYALKAFAHQTLRYSLVFTCLITNSIINWRILPYYRVWNFLIFYKTPLYSSVSFLWIVKTYFFVILNGIECKKQAINIKCASGFWQCWYAVVAVIVVIVEGEAFFIFIFLKHTDDKWFLIVR